MSKLGAMGHRLYTGEISYDFLGRRRRWYTISAILIVISLIALVGFRLTFGIEFKGGADFKANTSITATSVQQMHDALEASGVPNLEDATISTIGSTQIRVQTRTLDPTGEVPQVREAIAKQAGAKAEDVAYSLIGASWGSQITNRAVIALVVFLGLVGLVIWGYFRNGKMSIAALVALLHDLVLTVGIYALIGFTVTPATLIGVLTILGYSLYDTVVVFDKVRETTRDLRSGTTRTYSEAANLAINQVLVRSINTTVIGVLPVAALLFAGGVILGEGPLKDLALALFVGMVSGAYSSIFIATPLLAQLKEREPEMQKLATRVAARRSKVQARQAVSVGAPDPVRTDPLRIDADRVSDPDRPVRTAAPSSSSRLEPDAEIEAVPVRATATRPADLPQLRTTSEGASKRPQPQRKPRSQRKRQ